MTSELTYTLDYSPYMTYQADLFDDYGDCYFDGFHIGTRLDYEIANDL